MIQPLIVKNSSTSLNLPLFYNKVFFENYFLIVTFPNCYKSNYKPLLRKLLTLNINIFLKLDLKLITNTTEVLKTPKTVYKINV